MSNQLDEIIRAHKQGQERGIVSVCSTHPWVLRTALQGADPVLIESTCNQVNQYGGYTGMTPGNFVTFIHNLARETDFPVRQLILGGDHLGPSVWQNEPIESAMQKAEKLVEECVQAGYTKIHLDASMKLGGDDESNPLELELVARRTARLAKIAESTCSDPGPDCKLRYVIGSEVPLPGGVVALQGGMSVTKVEQVKHMLELMQAAFYGAGLQAAWERVIALVVQPGVEFGHNFIHDYTPELARELSRFAETSPYVYEVHSTDYQTPENLRRLVRDHFAILKVGPALTFAFREAVFALAKIEDELMPPQQCSRLIEKVDEAMLLEPAYWMNHYRGTEQEIALARKYSLSDRVRYYWPQPDVQAALDLLMQNLGGKPLPLSLVSQYLPHHYILIREGKLVNSAKAILTGSIFTVLHSYLQACGQDHGSSYYQ